MFGRFIQFFKFCIVGISNTLISYIAYFVFCKVGFHYLVASTVGFILSVINAFFWNNKYVFTIWIEVGGFDELVAPIINIVITTPINYLLNKIYAFKDRKE